MRENERIRRRFRCFGAVQGVGFRWRARHAAAAAGATGWVRNEGDGSVTLELQGTEEQVAFVLDALKNGRFIHIERMESMDIPLREERGFGDREDEEP